MVIFGRIPGYKYIYKTEKDNIAVVRVGLINRREWLIDYNDPSSISECVYEIMMTSPVYQAKSGKVQEIMAEVERWSVYEKFKWLKHD